MINEAIVWQLIREQEVWLAFFPFEERPWDGKHRPVLVLEKDGKRGEVLCLPITSARPRDRYDLPVDDWLGVPLRHLSTVRASKVRYLEPGNFVRRLGRFSDSAWEKACALVSDYLAERGGWP